MICFCILDINTLSHASFANIFSHSEGCLFCLQVSLICTIFWVYLGPFIYFYFIFISLGGGSRKLLLQSMSKNVLPVFSSKSSIIFSLTFRFLIHFEFIFVCGVKECSSFILSQIVVQFFQHHLLKRLLFFFLSPTVYSCLFCHRWGDHRWGDHGCMCLSENSLLFHRSMCFCASTILFWNDCSFAI